MFFQIFFTFLKIGLFTFGGGYAMISLIQHEVVVEHGWLTYQEFTDILAVSQLTPGPVGINVATYTGYTVAANAGCSSLVAVLGAAMASFAVVLLPVLLMLAVSQWLQRHNDNPVVKRVVALLRLVIIGVIAAAAVSLFNVESFGQPGVNARFVWSALIFVVVFTLSVIKELHIPLGRHELVVRRVSPIVLLLASGLLGFLVYM